MRTVARWCSPVPFALATQSSEKSHKILTTIHRLESPPLYCFEQGTFYKTSSNQRYLQNQYNIILSQCSTKSHVKTRTISVVSAVSKDGTRRPGSGTARAPEVSISGSTTSSQLQRNSGSQTLGRGPFVGCRTRGHILFPTSCQNMFNQNVHSPK